MNKINVVKRLNNIYKTVKLLPRHLKLKLNCKSVVRSLCRFELDLQIQICNKCFVIYKKLTIKKETRGQQPFYTCHISNRKTTMQSVSGGGGLWLICTYMQHLNVVHVHFPISFNQQILKECCSFQLLALASPLQEACVTQILGQSSSWITIRPKCSWNTTIRRPDRHTNKTSGFCTQTTTIWR